MLRKANLPKASHLLKASHLPLALAVLGVTVVGPLHSAWAQDTGGPLLSSVELNLQNAGTDDQLIKLARAAKINIMADASDGPEAGAKQGNRIRIYRSRGS